jgi:hypothetical protein
MSSNVSTTMRAGVGIGMFFVPPEGGLNLKAEIPTIQYGQAAFGILTKHLSGRYEKDKTGLGPQFHR